MPNRRSRSSLKARSNESGSESAEEKSDSEYAIQSVVELEEKRLGRKLKASEIQSVINFIYQFDAPSD
jgi:hypothetical protein